MTGQTVLLAECQHRWGVDHGPAEGELHRVAAPSLALVSTYLVRTASVSDAPGMAYVHVRSWQETYRGLVPNERLDRPDLKQRRKHWWTKAIAEGAEGTTRVVVAEHQGKIVGIASSGAPRDADAAWSIELFVLYVLADFHGSGIGADLLDAAIADAEAALWVADPNPRAQAFYRKHRVRGRRSR